MTKPWTGPDTAVEIIANQRKLNLLVGENGPGSVATLWRDTFESVNEQFQLRHQYSCTITQDALPEASENLAGQTLVFLGSSSVPWVIKNTQRLRLACIIHRSSRVILAGGAVFLPSQLGVHQNLPVVVHSKLKASAGELNIPSAPHGENVLHHGHLKSAASGLASLNLFKTILIEDLGVAVGNAVCSQLGVCDFGAATHTRIIWEYLIKGNGNPAVSRAVAIMSENIENPISIARIAEKSGASTRHLERQFRLMLAESPTQVYRTIRLEHAHELLSNIEMALMEIVEASGFASVSHLSKHFRARYGMSPVEFRDQSTSHKITPKYA